jgi:hypothetical protein
VVVRMKEVFETIRIIRQCLEKLGLRVVTVDLSTSGKPSPASVHPREVARHHPSGEAAVFSGDRGSAVTGMALAFENYVRTRRDLGGIISAGGSGGTSLATPGMRVSLFVLSGLSLLTCLLLARWLMRSKFGRVLQGPVIRVMNLRYARIGRRPKFDLAVLAPQGEGRTTPMGEQQVYHQGQWWTAQRYERLSLPVGMVVQGPAILEQPDTTVWLEPGFEGRVDNLGNLLVERTA